ncbi:NAD(P)-dependent alcohol dehydrogenase [Bacillus sp. B15-48]|uniref:NAD(P)-dependent alcohol dehydrogenase n=1 Tax=Bacillus sp. B15-48 TaxID=1548601 RepID=UPI00193EC6A2|nr:NAD(P)-dependent alcohol dehydrogenase [Bacillus sp. B15-48]
MKMKAAVTEGKGKEFEIKDILLEEPKAGEVLIKIVASGICHSDMIARDQFYPVPLPAVLGHEGSGIVEKVGPGVSSVEPGDHVVLSFSYCGQCKNCLNGRPFVCEKFFDLNIGGAMGDCTYRMHLNDHPVSHFFGQSSFAQYSIVAENNLVKVEKDIDVRLLGPLGCGIQTGAGAVLNKLKPFAGSSLAVFGCGTVGLSALMAAKAIGATTIIAVDVHENRLEMARELGATHTINSRHENPVERIIELTSEGVNYAVETSGHVAVLRQTVDSLTFQGVTAVIGAPPMGTEVAIDVNDVLLKEKMIVGVVEGDSIPQVFIPQLLKLYKQGKFPFDKLVKYYDFDNINQAISDSESGLVIKPILKINE